MSNHKLRWRDSNWLALTLAALLCGSCLLLACALPTALTYVAGTRYSAQASGSVSLIPMCAWARNGNVGLWWNSSIAPSRVVSSSKRYNAICIAMPWSATLPARGRPTLDVVP